jgi:hypothetical protein
MLVGLITRRSAVAAVGVLAFRSLAGVRAARAETGVRFRQIRVDVFPLRANAGDPTASWVELELPGDLARALAAFLSPSDRNGATLLARIDSIYLGPSAGGFGMAGKTRDAIQGILSVTGARGGGVAAETHLRITTSYSASGAEQALIEEAYHSRVIALAQAFAEATPGQLGL